MMCATQLNPSQPNHCFTALPVRARERQSCAPKKHIIGVHGRGSYSDRVTVYPYNGYIKSTNPIVRKLRSLQYIPIMMCATQLNPNQPNRHFTALPVRAREHQIRGPKKHILWVLSRVSYSNRVTVYPYNRHLSLIHI